VTAERKFVEIERERDWNVDSLSKCAQRELERDNEIG
jgi:hypothetical protein